jgi:hypothetical protein
MYNNACTTKKLHLDTFEISPSYVSIYEDIIIKCFSVIITKIKKNYEVKTMTRFKKTIAYFIAVSMVLLSFNVPVFATVGMSESEPNDLGWSATEIPSNFDLTQEIQGSIKSAGDADYYKFVPTNSGGYSIATLGTTDTFGYLYDSIMSPLDVSDDQTYPDGKNFELRYELEAYRTYYIKVVHKDPTATGDYKLKITPITNKYQEIEPNGSFETSQTLSNSNSTTTAEIGIAGDEDYYKLTPSGNGTFTFETTGSTDTYGSLYDKNYNLILSDDNSGEGNNMKITNYLAANETYYVKINHPIAQATGDYSLKVTQAYPVPSSDVDGNDFSSAKDLTTDKNYVTYSGSGINSPDDADFFKFTPKAEGMYTFKSTGNSDVYGEVYDSNQTLIKSDDNSGSDGNFSMSIPLTVNKTYYLKVTASNGTPGMFSLDIAQGKCLQVPQYLQLPYDQLCWATSGSMAISYFNHDTINRTLEIAQSRAKTDFADLKAIYGEKYYMYPSVFNQPGELVDCSKYTDPSIGLQAGIRTNTNADPRIDYHCGYTDSELMKCIDHDYPILVLMQNAKGGSHSLILKGYKYDSNGLNIIYNDPLDGQEHMVAHDVLRIFGYETFYYSSGTDNEPNNTMADYNDLGPNNSVQGNIGYSGDVDFYEFKYSNGPTHKCVIETTGTTDTYGELYDIHGNPVPSAVNVSQDNNFKIEFTANPYECYYIKVSHKNGGTGSYTVKYTTDTSNINS